MDATETSVQQATRALRLISSKAAPVKAQSQIVVEKADREPIAYRFDVIRDDAGRITQIVMTPLE